MEKKTTKFSASHTIYLKILLLCIMMGIPLVNCQLSRDILISQLQKEQQESLASGSISEEGYDTDLAMNVLSLSKHKVRSRRETVENCSEVESPSGSGLHKIKEVRLSQYRFFIKPDPEFRELVFNMVIDNIWNINDPYMSPENLVIRKGELETDSEDSWLEVEVQYYRHVVTYGKDRHGLRVTVGALTRTMYSRRWWRTHSFEGFVISVRGPSKMLFDCYTSDFSKLLPIKAEYRLVLLGCILSAVFLLVVVLTWVYIVISRRRRLASNHAPPVPPATKSMLLWRSRVKSDPDPVYEEFGEDTLARLRQKLDPQTFGSYNATSGASSTDQHKNLKANAKEDEPEYRRDHYDNFKPLSLLEQKQKAWLDEPQGEPPESHYVEMHGIINRNSQLGN
ncbi:uncharacterized protein [Procambarus clarkii]|uniref:uncharacterized protein n=1 Tax=Procambarus clarkii TaxID=6728 RepID=UPI001E678E44|nr:uncharacterized protein LOC123763156 [Procambarus clarkii]